MSDEKRNIRSSDLEEGEALFDEEDRSRKSRSRDREDASSPEGLNRGVRGKSVVVVSLIMVFVVLGAIAFFIYYVNDMLTGGQDAEKERAARIAAQDAAIQAQAEEAKKVKIETESDLQSAKERIEILERYITQIVGTLESSDIRVITSELEREKQERQALQGLLEETLDEIDALKAKISEQQTSQQQGQETVEETPKIPPSTSATTQLDTTGAWFAERKAERERIANEMKEKQEADDARFDARPGIPATGIINAVLKTKIVSTMILDKFYVQAETTEDYDVGEGMVLKRGAIFYGRAMPDFKSRRLGVELEGLRVGHVQIPMKGVLLDKHGAPGLVSKYVDPFYRNLWLAMIPYAVQYVLTDKDDVNIEETTSDGGGTSTKRKSNARRDVLDSAATDLSGQIVEHGRQDSPVIIMNSGLPVQVQFTEKLPLEVLVESKSVAISKTPLDNPFLIPNEEYHAPLAGGTNAQWKAPKRFTVFEDK